MRIACCKIYTLADPRTLKVRYVGYSRKPKERLKQHIYEARRNYGRGSPKNSWIMELLIQGMRPRLTVIESCSIEDSSSMERKWIAIFESQGYDLLNISGTYKMPHLIPKRERNIDIKMKVEQDVQCLCNIITSYPMPK